MEDITLSKAKERVASGEFAAIYGMSQLHDNPDWDRHLANILDGDEIVGRILSNRNGGKTIAYFI